MLARLGYARGMSLPTPRGGPSSHERGAALAELTVVIPVMLLMLLVLFDFGRGFLAYISVTNGARDAARVAMEDGVTCDKTDPKLSLAATNGAAPYSITLSVVEDGAAGTCKVTVTHVYEPILPFVTSSFSLPGIGQVGPLWSGTMSESMVSK